MHQLHTFTHLGVVVILIRDEELWEQRGLVTCPRSHSGREMSAELRILRKCRGKGWFEVTVWGAGSQSDGTLMLFNFLCVQNPFWEYVEA